MARSEFTGRALSIGEVARAAGLAASAIRYYEAQGLLPEPSRQGDKRRYGDDVLARLEIIRLGQDAGFNLKEIGVLTAGIEGGRRGPEALAKLARDKLPEIDESLKRLRLMKKLLTAASECCCPDLATCAAAVKRSGLSSETEVRKPAGPPRQR